MSVRIAFSELFTYSAENTDVHLPLAELGRGAGHIHGRLEVVIDGRSLPRMGFWGPSDVCFNPWVEELRRVVSQLGPSESATYLFDEGEQGQPAFEFRREGWTLFVSVVESALSDAPADPAFQSVSCSWAEFRAQVDSFLPALREAVLAAAPGPGKAWWKRSRRSKRHPGESS
jgi:hypothetical protein